MANEDRLRRRYAHDACDVGRPKSAQSLRPKGRPLGCLVEPLESVLEILNHFLQLQFRDLKPQVLTRHVGGNLDECYGYGELDLLLLEADSKVYDGREGTE